MAAKIDNVAAPDCPSVEGYFPEIVILGIMIVGAFKENLNSRSDAGINVANIS